MFTCNVPIAEDMINNPYRHVHHADTVKILEHGRLKLLEHLGIPNTEFMFEQGFPIVVVDLNVRYRRELKPGVVTVSVDTCAIESRLIKMSQRIILDGGEDAVVAKVVCVCISPQTTKSISPPREFIEKVEALYGK